MIPRQRPGQSFEAHQDEMAAWSGYPDRDTLNRDHDSLHKALCRWLGVDSQALREGAGEPLSEPEMVLAGMEEEAVLHVQRWARHAGAEIPK